MIFFFFYIVRLINASSQGTLETWLQSFLPEGISEFTWKLKEGRGGWFFYSDGNLADCEESGKNTPRRAPILRALFITVTIPQSRRVCWQTQSRHGRNNFSPSVLLPVSHPQFPQEKNRCLRKGRGWRERGRETRSHRRVSAVISSFCLFRQVSLMSLTLFTFQLISHNMKKAGMDSFCFGDVREVQKSWLLQSHKTIMRMTYEMYALGSQSVCSLDSCPHRFFY